jgi:hypothetical protein
MRGYFIRAGAHRRWGRWHGGQIAAAFLLVLMAVSVGAGPLSADELKKSGTVDIEQTQIAFIGSGNLGGGKLYFGGKIYSFTIGGLGIGGFGISRMTAVGTVFNLTDVSQFAGAYVQGRYGYAAGASGSGELWLQNDAGVVMQLKTQREGLALSLGGDAVYIRFD